MPIRYDITHTTLYRYSEPVRFGEHRVMFRPRDSHDLRVLATDLICSPEARVRLIQDPHSNSVALVTPLQPADELKITCTFTIEHAPGDGKELELSPSATRRERRRRCRRWRCCASGRSTATPRCRACPGRAPSRPALPIR